MKYKRIMILWVFDHDKSYIFKVFYICFESFISHFRFMYTLDKDKDFGALKSEAVHKIFNLESEPNPIRVQLLHQLTCVLVLLSKRETFIRYVTQLSIKLSHIFFTSILRLSNLDIITSNLTRLTFVVLSNMFSNIFWAYAHWEIH